MYLFKESIWPSISHSNPRQFTIHSKTNTFPMKATQQPVELNLSPSPHKFKSILAEWGKNQVFTVFWNRGPQPAVLGPVPGHNMPEIGLHKQFFYFSSILPIQTFTLFLLLLCKRKLFICLYFLFLNHLTPLELLVLLEIQELLEILVLY